MNTFSENGNDFVGRLLHEGGFRVGPFPHFPKPKRPVRDKQSADVDLMFWSIRQKNKMPSAF